MWDCKLTASDYIGEWYKDTETGAIYEITRVIYSLENSTEATDFVLKYVHSPNPAIGHISIKIPIASRYQYVDKDNPDVLLAEF